MFKTAPGGFVSTGQTFRLTRKSGWPTTIKTFRTKRDAADWARRTEDEMVRGIYVDRAGSEKLTFKQAIERYLKEVSPTKRPGTAKRERQAADALLPELGDYALAALTPDVIATYRDARLADGKSPDTVRIELALRGPREGALLVATPGTEALSRLRVAFVDALSVEAGVADLGFGPTDAHRPKL